MPRRIPAALRSQLLLTGQIDPHGLTETTQRRTCTRCHAPVLAAVEFGHPVITDRAALTPRGELDALLAGRTTYRHNGSYLVARFAVDIAEHPAGSDRYADVVADHKCGAAPISTKPSIHCDHEYRVRPGGIPPF